MEKQTQEDNCLAPNNISVHDHKACIFSITQSLSIHSYKLHEYLESDAKFVFNKSIFYKVSTQGQFIVSWEYHVPYCHVT